jgi:hypothetical protein
MQNSARGRRKKTAAEVAPSCGLADRDVLADAGSGTGTIAYQTVA